MKALALSRRVDAACGVVRMDVKREVNGETERWCGCPQAGSRMG